MNAFFSTLHPSEGFDIIVAYDKDSLRIENVWDDNKEEVFLSKEDVAVLNKEVERNQT